MREGLLCVCSKMADETILVSKLPVADRTREVSGRKLWWWCLSSGFPLRMFLLGFADFFFFFSFFFFFRIHQHPFLWGLAPYARTCPTTLLVCWSLQGSLSPVSVAQLDAPSDWRPGSRGFNQKVGNILSWRLIMKYFLRSFSLFRRFKEGQLSVSCERMCKILDNRLED